VTNIKKMSRFYRLYEKSQPAVLYALTPGKG
jgi:hypothetical protein